MRRSLPALAAALAAAASSVGAQTLPQGEALTRAIVERDAELFALVFDQCDPARLRGMLAPDFEMYHDRGGVVARAAEPFVAQYAKDCAARSAPGASRSRRELEPATHSVHPVPGHGAIQDGWHVFYERQGEGPETKVGRARFTHLWRLEPDGWRLARVFSYAHGGVD